MLTINFTPSSSQDDKYDLYVEGKLNLVDVTAEEVLESLEDILNQGETIEEYDLFFKALEECNLLLPDPQIPLGQCITLVHTNSSKPHSTKYIEVYDKVNVDSSSFLIFVLYEKSGTPKWGFFISRDTKEVGKITGWNALPPTGEIRQRIIETLIQKLGRTNIKITL